MIASLFSGGARAVDGVMARWNTASRVCATAMLLAIVMPASRAAAAPPAASGVGTLSLSDAEKAELLDHGTEASVARARSGLAGASDAAKQIHGEVGLAVGSNGARQAYGVAAIPLGDHAGAIVSFESSRYGHPR